jgi:hypothetical protein
MCGDESGIAELTLVADQPASRHSANNLCGEFWRVPAPPTRPTHDDDGDDRER